MQEIALILVLVKALEQRGCVAAVANAGIVTRGNQLGAEAPRVIQKYAELDLAVAQYVGIGRAPALVLAEEIGENALAVIGREIGAVERDAEAAANVSRVAIICRRRAVAFLVLLPVDHEQTMHVIVLAL